MTPEQHARARQYLLVPENFASPHGRHELKARLAAIDEFLVRASPDTPPPASWFDADFYLTCRAGADPVHANPYLDFVLSGRFAGYYPSAQALERDAEAIAAARPAGAA